MEGVQKKEVLQGGIRGLNFAMQASCNNEGHCFAIVVWRTGCKAESYRDENALASANAALFAHLGERIGQLGSGKLGDLVRREGEREGGSV